VPEFLRQMWSWTTRDACEGTAMSPGIQSNGDLSAVFASLIARHSVGWVMEQQPVGWRPPTWQNYWQTHKLPHPHVVDELQKEYATHQTIRRSFVFTYQYRSPVELFIAAMAWGSGTGGRGLFRVRTILAQANAAEVIEAIVNAVRQDGTAAGYSKYYTVGRLPQLDVAFIAKVLYFAGYQEPREPRPLIYDSRVASAVIRLPDSPLLPSIQEGVSASAYQRYCCWAERTAADYGTEPVVLEWALFHLGGQIKSGLGA
jgi:hypothetical protein